MAYFDENKCGSLQLLPARAHFACGGRRQLEIHLRSLVTTAIMHALR